MRHHLLLAHLTFALCAGSALAQEVRVYRANEAVDPRDVTAILAPAAPRPIKMRSIRLLDDAGTPSAQQEVVADTASPATPSALALPVQFAFDSCEIQPSARSQLDALAEGIGRLAPNRKVVIEGHTDAVGTEHYNEELSARRAEAVKRYLVGRHGIDASRLRTVGMGKYALLQGRDPLAAENRRVQFRGE
jgi:outer membrane protein OmpA-like peptidoglycan-associated protein